MPARKSPKGKRATSKPPKLSHLSASGEARMVNVGAKPDQRRRAAAEGRLCCHKQTIKLLKESALPKGDVLTVAKIAGIQAAKMTSQLIPLCHPLPLHHVSVEFQIEADGILIRAETETNGKTGVEMEALTAVSVAALAIYDMCKAVDKAMRIDNIRVVEKIKQ
ncbi:MAG: cyclic pyranopterin monophosphate synthase MoaC [Verrucomicrobia bacterium]|nr:cyclic pyranopterin monophosphate synthase MoaC [Verrucomicrobiota bacterium]